MFKAMNVRQKIFFDSADQRGTKNTALQRTAIAVDLILDLKNVYCQYLLKGIEIEEYQEKRKQIFQQLAETAPY